MMSLLISLRSERLKTKRTTAFYLTIIAAFFGPFMSMLDASFSEGISAESGPVLFQKMMTDKFEMTGYVMFPLFIVLICTLLPQIEYRNNTWKQVFASPQTQTNVFIAKLINTHFLIAMFLILNLFGMFLTVVVLHFRNPSLHVLSQPVDVSEIIAIRLNIYCALLAMAAIQFWLGLRFKNFIASIAIGVALWITGNILAMQFESGIAAYFPYSFSVYSILPKHKPVLNNILFTSGILAFVFLVFGFIDFKRRVSKA